MNQTVLWARSFGAPPAVKNAARTHLCISGDWLPSQVFLNGNVVKSLTSEHGQSHFEIGQQLLERNKVELCWDQEASVKANDNGFTSLRSVHLEIWE